MKEGSFGLVGMREIVELLEGEMKIDSQPGAGTLVFIKVPYHLQILENKNRHLNKLGGRSR
ncbi:hypothetical protein J7E95_27975 [Streptomyces sp. ISL-14]|nr:hypothetical protein [Streptomyces sp. ISL-14]